MKTAPSKAPDKTTQIGALSNAELTALSNVLTQYFDCAIERREGVSHWLAYKDGGALHIPGHRPISFVMEHASTIHTAAQKAIRDAERREKRHAV